MAASEINDHQNRSGVMGWLYIPYFSDDTTPTHCLTMAIAIHPHPHYHRPNLYQIDTLAFLTQSLSQQPAMCTIPLLGLHPANERCRYKVTPSLIGWAQT